MTSFVAHSQGRLGFEIVLMNDVGPSRELLKELNVSNAEARSDRGNIGATFAESFGP